VQQEANNVSCLNSRAIIEYVRVHHPERMADLLRELPEPWGSMRSVDSYLCDEDNWVPSGLVVELFKRVRWISGSGDVAFRIGYESFLRREYSYFQKLFLNFFSSPSGTFGRMNQINTKLNTTKVIEMIYNAPGRVGLRWHWKSGVTSSKDICEYNKGIYCAIPTLWGLPPAKVEETSCHFLGAEYCENRFTWSASRGVLSTVFGRVLTRTSSLLTALEEIDRDKELLRERFDQLATLNEELSQKVTMLKAINNATRAIVSVADTRTILRQTMTPIVEVFGFDRAMIMLVNPTRDYLEYSYAVGETAAAIDKLRGYRIPLTRDQNLLVRVLKRRKPVLIRDAKSAGLNTTNRILADFRPSSFVVCPLIADDRTIGILGADRRGDRPRLTSNDAEFLSIFANNIATALQRARLDEELKESYVSSVGALVKAIEEKDTYTSGHSERVSQMVVRMAREMRLPEAEIEYLRLGSILHDVGKIGISESIVKSPKRLTAAEIKIIQKHPAKGIEILKPIAFMRDHMYLVRSHHERWDGTGYPDRLAGDSIPLGAQIVAVADAYDAMTSSRAYRKGMPTRQAIREIEKNAGTQFSPRTAEAFLAVIARTPVPDASSDVAKRPIS
jgi:putative nucleotidyltransferase with HDIG domain